MADVVTMINSTMANLTLAHNTPYNVSVEADLCGRRNSTTIIELNYGGYTYHTAENLRWKEIGPTQLHVPLYCTNIIKYLAEYNFLPMW